MSAPLERAIQEIEALKDPRLRKSIENLRREAKKMRRIEQEGVIFVPEIPQKTDLQFRDQVTPEDLIAALAVPDIDPKSKNKFNLYAASYFNAQLGASLTPEVALEDLQYIIPTDNNVSPELETLSQQVSRFRINDYNRILKALVYRNNYHTVGEVRAIPADNLRKLISLSEKSIIVMQTALQLKPYREK